jgi:hypothetical protein
MKQQLFNLRNILVSPYHKIKDRGTFNYNGSSLPYFIHWYNHTWDNSRRIEIPIFKQKFKEYIGMNILEVGNVMDHYGIVYHHDVLDKYEKKSEVINEDVLIFKPRWKYDIVLSCSTLEHVGFDKPEKSNPDALLLALENLQENVVKKGGVIFFSVPLGYNPDLDKLLLDDCIHLDNEIFYRDDGEDWVPCDRMVALLSGGLLFGRVDC